MEFKIKNVNNMSDEEILWALKKLPRNQLSTHDKTLLIGCIESIKNKIDKGETNCMKTVKETKNVVSQKELVLEWIEKIEGETGKKLENLCKEARKVINPISGYKDLRFNGKTCFGNDILPGLKAGEKYTFFSQDYDDGDEYSCYETPFNFTCGGVFYSRKGSMQWVVAKEKGEKVWKVYYVNGHNYIMKPDSEEFHSLNVAIKEAKEMAEYDDMH